MTKKPTKFRKLVLEAAGPVGPYKRVLRDRTTGEIAVGITDDSIYTLVEAVLDGEAFYQLILWAIAPTALAKKIQQQQQASIRSFSVKVVGRHGPKRPKKLPGKVAEAHLGKKESEELIKFLSEHPPYQNVPA